ncbi:MAG: adenosylcobinamide-GDP ribazoletransferase [Dissulfurispiraceae bacterium]
MKKVLLAFQFLTIIPVKVSGEMSENLIARSSVFFPLVGAFQGLLVVFAATWLMKPLPSDIVSGLIICALIISNGGFHLDGLADTFDAIAVKSTGDQATDREKRLAVMKDSATGAIGVTAIVLTILMKVLLINNVLTHMPLPDASFILFLMPVFSKWIMVPSMYHGISARRNGIGKTFVQNTKLSWVALSSLIVVVLYGIASQIESMTLAGSGYIILLVLLFASLYLFSLMVVRFCRKTFGGLTGDCLGALSELSEILFLMVSYIWLRRSI